ncbi:hypothetical protein OSB04_019284 [Centaurea solstitialis]|uniref:Uncharacterized protein n=1 Tax=Centaurea solstitialis TaxID=347529 RepID=A0AA38WFR3_9ASTR|nr:hypothetical protein OSB04_019284 [Centaurea solstitialis]
MKKEKRFTRSICIEYSKEEHEERSNYIVVTHVPSTNESETSRSIKSGRYDPWKLTERGKDFSDLIYTNVCGLFKSATRNGERYFVTFTDNFRGYGFIYLIKKQVVHLRSV